MTVEELLKKYNITQTELSRRFNIPARTVRSWCNKGNSHRECPEYVIGMLDMLLRMDPEEKEQ